MGAIAELTKEVKRLNKGSKFGTVGFIKQMWIDPSTGQPGGSRFITWWVAVVILPMALLLHTFVRDLGSGWMAITALGGVTGIGYAGNSIARVWNYKEESSSSEVTVED